LWNGQGALCSRAEAVFVLLNVPDICDLFCYLLVPQTTLLKKLSTLLDAPALPLDKVRFKANWEPVRWFCSGWGYILSFLN